jgi:hypothetical protein
MGVVPVPISQLVSQYPRRDRQNPAVYKYVENIMKGIPGTPCCVQMSHAFNMSGVTIPSGSYRRTPTARQSIGGRTLYYLLAVDEFEHFLTKTYGDPEDVNVEVGKGLTGSQIRKRLRDRPGIVAFRFSGPGRPAPKGEFEHIELWTGGEILQRDMAEDFLFRRPRVLFWDTNDTPKWLSDYMATQA